MIFIQNINKYSISGKFNKKGYFEYLILSNWKILNFGVRVFRKSVLLDRNSQE